MVFFLNCTLNLRIKSVQLRRNSSLIDSFLIGLASIEVKRSLINSLNDDVVDVGGERKFVLLVLDL